MALEVRCPQCRTLTTRVFRKGLHFVCEACAASSRPSQDLALFEKELRRVAGIVQNYMRARGIPAAEFEHLENTALIALADCARRFDPRTGNRFTTFYVPRVLGALKDEGRNKGWVNTRRRLKVSHTSIDTHEDGKGIIQLLPAKSGIVDFIAEEEVEKLLSFVPPGREREIVRLRHIEGLSQKEVGERFGLSESRVCQIEQRAIDIARPRVKQYLAG